MLTRSKTLHMELRVISSKWRVFISCDDFTHLFDFADMTRKQSPYLDVFCMNVEITSPFCNSQNFYNIEDISKHLV